MVQELVVSEAVKSVVKCLVERLVIPKIEYFKNEVQSFYKENMIPRGEFFEEYLLRSYNKYSIVNTLVFKNERRLLKDLYVPLSVVTDSHSEKTKIVKRIDSFPSDLLKQYSRILISDTAGMGKSTLSKFLFLSIIDQGIGIPIFIEMRRLSSERPILKEIHEQLNSLNKVFDSKLLLDFLRTGGFVFFLDGYDEVSLSERAFVTANVQDFVSKAQMNTFILSSRPEAALSSFGDFQCFKIRPLLRDEAYSLLKKYDNEGVLSSRLVNELESGQYSSIDEFLTNPLLVSLLFAAYDYKQTIPLKKSIFYRQVYDAYFDSHDISKGDSYIHEKKSKLDTDEFGRVLRYIAFECLKKHRIEFDKDSLLGIISTAKDNCPDLDFSPSDFLYDALSAVPLFCVDGQYYKWVHKSLQEYFAAMFIHLDAKESQSIILDALYNSEDASQYINLLDIYYDIDTWGFKERFELPILETYVKHYTILCYPSTLLSQVDIEERIGHLFLNEICFLQVDWNSIPEKGVFQYVKEKTSSIFKGDLSTVSHFNGEDILVALSRSPKLAYLFLLHKRIPELFKEYTLFRKGRIKLLQEGDVFYIDAHTADNDPKRYRDFNKYMASLIHESGYLDYDKCKREISTIQDYIKRREDKSIMVLGL